jgi:hypothetical protein
MHAPPHQLRAGQIVRRVSPPLRKCPILQYFLADVVPHTRPGGGSVKLSRNLLVIGAPVLMRGCKLPELTSELRASTKRAGRPEMRRGHKLRQVPHALHDALGPTR